MRHFQSNLHAIHIALGFILPFGASMPWKRGNLSTKAKDLLVLFVLAVPCWVSMVNTRRKTCLVQLA